MADLDKVLEHVLNAERELKSATEGMVPLSAIKQVEAYVLGVLRGSITTVREARDAIMQSADFKRKKLQASTDGDSETLKG